MQFEKHRMMHLVYVLVPTGSVSDPDPHGSALRKTPWIRIRMEDADPDPEG